MKKAIFATIGIILTINAAAQLPNNLVMVWNDEFEGTQLDATKWKTCPEWQRQGFCYWEADNHQLTGSGQLRLDVTEVGDSVFCGAVRTKNLYYQKYGYFEVRCQVPQIHGGWSAFWMMPDQNQPGNQGTDGTEIDIFESVNGWIGMVNHALHWDGYGVEHQTVKETMHRPDLYDGSYHTFGMFWTPTEYVFYIDSIETWRTSAGGVSQVEQYMKLTLEVSSATWPGNWDNQIVKPIH
jgi:beta-glucanase (GH16 family)